MNPSFYFEQLLQTALGGLDVNVTGPVVQLAGVVLLLSMLFGIYEAYSHGGDVRQLALVGGKYLLLGLVLANYQEAFRAINAMFNGVADYLYNLNGIGDLYKSWSNDLAQHWGTNWWDKLWTLVTGGVSAVIAGIITVIGYLLLPITYTIFTVAYAVYGSVLYIAGPFVLALMPSRSLGRLARAYFQNVMIFHAWGLIYAILQVMMTALQMGSVDQVIANNSVFNAFVGTDPATLLSVASVLLSASIAIIPIIASRIVQGDVGNTVWDAVRAASFATAVVAFGAQVGVATVKHIRGDHPPGDNNPP